jgi:gliding motility-associated-like protein
MKFFNIFFVKRNFTLFFIIFTSINSILSQSLVINELSQGPSGNKEYVEFLVVPGNGPYQCSNYCLDLRGWVIDDNNGYFSGGGGSGIGIAAGAVRFSNNSFWQCIPIGTLILIYNDQDLNVTVPSNDNSLTDGNCRLVLPISSTLFENQTVSPTTANTSYPTSGWLPGGSWGPISMANGGDSFQVYDPSSLTIPVHGVSWVNNNVNNIIYFGTSATNSVYYFGNVLNNDPSNQSNWIVGTCSAPDNQSPGLPNNAANATYIQSLTNNCAGPLNATLSINISADNCECNGSASVTVIGSIPGYSFQWVDASNSSIGQNMATASNLCPGNYSCIVTSSINCIDTIFATINSSSATITPTFTQIPPICSGGVFTLPTTSNNGISGTWSPAINNSTTTTYTFTPNAGQCAIPTTMTVVVSNGLTPSFTQISAICQGGSIALPSSSSEGISGTWSPAINNSTTTTYTFTPNSGQCATSASMTINVTPPVTPTFNQIGPFCQGSVAPSFPNTSVDGITGVWGPPGINTGAIGTNTYVFVSNPGQCANNVSMAITVNPFLAPVLPVQEPICAGDNIILPAISSNGITGTWSPSINNSNTTTYTFTPSAGQCSSTTSMTVQVFAQPIIEAGNNVTICEGSSIELSANGGNQYSWSNGIQNGQSFIPFQSQVYYVTGTDINGCEASDSIIVTLIPIPNAQFSSDINSGTAPLLVTFSNTSSNATSFVWSYGDGNENSTTNLSNVSNTFLNPGEYTVWLIASNGFCTDSISSIVQVDSPADPIFEIPNVLTPNGDGTNDEWFIFTQNVSDLEVIILNRWGNEVSKLNGISESWNGRTPNGDEVTDGTYFYSYQAKAFNGKEFSGHGFLTLLR